MVPKRSVFAKAILPNGCFRRRSRGRLPACPKEEPELRIDEGMTPAIEDDAGTVLLRVESRGRKHVGELFADPSFVVGEPERNSVRRSTPAPL
jgi:hypothetical protein